MNVTKLRRRHLSALRLQILDLTSNQLKRTCRLCQLGNYFGGGIPWPTAGLCGDGECLRQKGIPGENGDTFAKYFVIRRFSTSKIVIIHRGKIVMDQRIGVDAL